MTAGTRQINDQLMKRIDAAIGRRVEQEIASHPPGTKVHDLGLAMGLVEMFEARDHGKYHDKTLLEEDRDAYDAIALRVVELQDMIQRLTDDPDVKYFLKQAHAFGLVEVLGSNFKVEIEKFGNYLHSDPFFDGLSGLSNEAVKTRVENELYKLVQLDPELAQDVIVEMISKAVARHIEIDPVKAVEDMTTAERAEAWDKFLQLVVELRLRATSGSGGSGTLEDLSRAATIYGTGKQAVDILLDATRRLKIAQALAAKVPTRTFYAAVLANDPSLLRNTTLTADERAAATEAMGWAKSYGLITRGATTLTSFLAIAGLVTSWPPKDARGRVDPIQLATFIGASFSVLGSAPTAARFVRNDLPMVISTALRAQTVASGTSVGTTITGSAKFVRYCAVVGVVGDALIVIVNVAGAFSAARSGDTVRMWSKIGQAIGGAIGLAGGILLLSGGAAATTVGMPLALVGAAVGLIAAAIEWKWGRDDSLSDKVYDDLEALGIMGAEGAAFGRLAEQTVQGRFPTTQRVDSATALARATRASTADKIALINTLLEEKTSGSEETLIYDLLCATPYSGGAFLDLIERLDCKRLATELEQSKHAGPLMARTLRAYELAGKEPGKAFTDQVWQHCKDGDEDAIENFLGRITNGPSTDDTINREVYKKVNAVDLAEATKTFLAKDLGGSEPEAIVGLLSFTSWTQFNAIIEHGGHAYVERLEMMPDEQWARVRGWMLDRNASPAVRQLANREATFNRFTSEWVNQPRSQTRVRSRMENERILAKAKHANKFEKITIVSGLLDNPGGEDESLIYGVLCDTPHTRNEFLGVMEGLDCKRVAKELEDDEEAADIMNRTLQAYHTAGRPAGPAFYDQFEMHCRRQRWKVINRFIDTVDQNLYRELDADKLYRAISMFDYDGHKNDEGKVAFKLLEKASWSQFNTMLELGHLVFVNLMKELMPEDRWFALHDRMRSANATPAVKNLALQVPR